jgi:tRNA-2-methylthio-N6-dimethylallyladenosine synthase
VVREARFAGAYTFLYSQRPGTPAASMPGQIPHEVMQDRYLRLVEVANDMAWAENKKLVGKTVAVLVANGEGRKDEATERVSGRAPDNRLVHVALDSAVGVPRPGDVITAEITHAAPHHLVADRVISLRRTRAGDVGEQPVNNSVLLGLPAMRPA